MSTPVGGVTDAPLYGGTRGVKRPVQGNPTSVPRNAPAFRGARNSPGDRVRAPAIEAKNRNDRGTNVTIPYSRLVQWDMLKDVGRISPGDAVFTSRMRTGGPHYAPTAAPTQIVGVDWMNRQLGNTPDPSAPKSEMWIPGYNVLLGGEMQNPDLTLGDFACDNWRECSILRGWCLDGVVLSNDEPGVYHGSGKNDAQLFNIAVQGLATVNNGYVDFLGKSLHTDHANLMGSGGTRAAKDYGGKYDYGTAKDPFYHRYPLQMFDRKVRVMSELFVGLVATKRIISDAQRERWRASDDVPLSEKEKLGPRLDGTGNPVLVSGTDLQVYKVNAFYTYRFAYFSTRSLWDYSYDLINDGLSKTNPYTGIRFPTKDGTGWRNESSERHGYHPTGHPTDGGTDAYATMTHADFQGLVGAWKVGKVFDVAARKREVHSSGPIDTSEALTVNVNIEWYDWRKLRYVAEDPTIGHMNAGALSWGYSMGPYGNPVLATYDRAAWRIGVSDAVFNWPSEYSPTDANEPYAFGRNSYDAPPPNREYMRVGTTLTRLGTVAEIPLFNRRGDGIQGFSAEPGTALTPAAPLRSAAGVEDPATYAGPRAPYLDIGDPYGDAAKWRLMVQTYEERVLAEKRYRRWLGEDGTAVATRGGRGYGGETARMTALRRLLKFSGDLDAAQARFIVNWFQNIQYPRRPTAPVRPFEAGGPNLTVDRMKKLAKARNQIEQIDGQHRNRFLRRLAPTLNDRLSLLYQSYFGVPQGVDHNEDTNFYAPMYDENAEAEIDNLVQTLFDDIQLLYNITRGRFDMLDSLLTIEEVEFYLNPVNAAGKRLTVEDLVDTAFNRFEDAYGARGTAGQTEAVRLRGAGEERVAAPRDERNIPLLSVGSQAPGTSNLGAMEVAPVEGAARPTQGSVAATVTAAAAAAGSSAAVGASGASAAAAPTAAPAAPAAGGKAPAAASTAAPAKRARRAGGAAQGSADVFATIFGGTAAATVTPSSSAPAAAASAAAAAGSAAVGAAAASPSAASGSEPASPAVSDQGSATGASAAGGGAAASKSTRSVRRQRGL